MERFALKIKKRQLYIPNVELLLIERTELGSEMFMGTKGDHSNGKVMTSLFYHFLTDTFLRWEMPDV